MTAVVFLGVAIVSFATACHRDGRGEGRVETDASVASPSSPSVPSVAADAGVDAATPFQHAGMNREGGLPACKIMQSENGPSPGTPASSWLDVAEHSAFSVRRLESGRELRFEGPGRVFPCSGDVALIARGIAFGRPGSGEAPGSEQWVGTACGALRWASGAHRITAGPTADECTIEVLAGVAHLLVASDMREPTAADAGLRANEWRTLSGKQTIHLRGSANLGGAAAVKAALAACEAAAEDVDRTARALASPTTDASAKSELAAKSVTSRGLARASCAIAAVRTELGGRHDTDRARLAKALHLFGEQASNAITAPVSSASDARDE